MAPILRGTALGSVLGMLRGGGAALASFGSYSLDKRLSRHPEEFGQGASLILIAAVLLVTVLLPGIRRKREQVFQEE